MKLLIVEDNEDEIEVFARELAKRGDVGLIFARSRDQAIKIIEDHIFDFAVVDLRIPPTHGSLDSDTSHGLAVRAALSERAPGTPVVIFSAYGTLPLVQNLLNTTETQDVWATGRSEPMTRFMQKSQLNECLALINTIADEIKQLSSIEISYGTHRLDLTYQDKTILRIFARMFGGTNIRISPLGGGLSPAKTCRIEVEDSRGAATCYAVVKLGSILDLLDEHRRVDKLVAPILEVGAFAHVIAFLRAGAGPAGGLFYGLAKEHDWTLADALRHAPASTPELVERIRKLEEPWQTSARVRQLTIAEIRQNLVEDQVMHDNTKELGFDWQALERMEIRITESKEHCDLHGLNVLLKNHCQPLLIDFATVGIAPACLDPVTLELSLLFHPVFKDLAPGWPSVEQAEQWHDLDIYTKGCPHGSYIRACRKWAFDIEAGDKAVFATAYAYAVRQLKYLDTNHPLAAAVARCCQLRLLAE